MFCITILLIFGDFLIKIIHFEYLLKLKHYYLKKSKQLLRVQLKILLHENVLI
jgi:membrane protein CcdC involved in cytochrome C biogenesis